MARGAWAWILPAIFVLSAAPPATGGHVDPSAIITVLQPDAIPAITSPSFDPDDAWLGPNSPVVGVVIDGDARAYPIPILNWHEIVDDVVGGRPVAVTFCPLCGTGVVFDRVVGDQPLVLKVSGKLYKNDLVMYDTATGSLWTQILGEAIQGPYHGIRLRVLTSSTMAWSEWKALHPGTRLLARPVGADGRFLRDYSVNPYEGYVGSSQVWFRQDNIDTTSDLHPKEYVLGVVRNGAAKAYPFRFLSQERVVNDVVGGDPIAVTFTKDTARAFLRGDRVFAFVDDASMRDGSGTTHDLLTGTARAGGQDLVPVDAIESFWFAWFDFHPGTDIYRIGPVPASHPDRAIPVTTVLAAGLAVLGVAALLLWRAGRLRGGRVFGGPKGKVHAVRPRNRR